MQYVNYVAVDGYFDTRQRIRLFTIAISIIQGKFADAI